MASEDSPQDPSQPEPGQGPGPDDAPEPDSTPGIDDLLGVLLQESTLWPLLIVFVTSIGALGAALIVLSLVDRNPFAAAALLLIAGMTIDLFWRSRRRRALRNLARGVGLIWLAALALAGLAYAFDIV